MVRGSIELLTSGELGAAAVTVCSHPDYKTGSVFLEALFLVECLAPKGLEMQRFLPPTCLRFVLDAQGNDCAEVLSHDQLQGLCLSQNRKLADTVVNSQVERVKLLLQHATGLADAAGADVTRHARNAVENELAAEQDRLIALAEVNANVRDDEIERLAARRQALLDHLASTRVRLDAMRLVVMR